MNLEQLKQQYDSFKPREDWVKATRKDLKSQTPGSNWTAYSSGIIVVLFLVFGLTIVQGPEQAFKIVEKEQEQRQLVEQVKEIKKTAKKIEKEIKQVLSVKTEISESDEIDPLVKLKLDLEKVENAGQVLQEIEKDIANGDYLIAREKLDKLLKNSNIEEPIIKVEGSKEINNN